MKYFCSKCGKTTQYSFEMPKFCAFCGQSFANNLTSKETEEKGTKFLNELKLKKNTNEINLNVSTEDHFESDSLCAPDINFKQIKPSFKLDIYKNKGETFGSLIDNPTEPSLDLTTEKINKTKEDILAEFQKEASALRTE